MKSRVIACLGSTTESAAKRDYHQRLSFINAEYVNVNKNAVKCILNIYQFSHRETDYVRYLFDKKKFIKFHHSGVFVENIMY